MERLKRYSEQVVALMSALVVMFGGVLSTSFHVKAESSNPTVAGEEFWVNYAQPSTSDTQGYLNLYLQHKETGLKVVTTIFWYCIATVNAADSPCGVYIEIYDDVVKIGPYTTTGATAAFISVSRYHSTGSLVNCHASSSSAYKESFSANWNILGYKYNGNVATFASDIGSGEYFTIYYSEEETAEILRDIYSQLLRDYNVSSDILNEVSNIYNSVDGLENQLSNVVSYLRSIDSDVGFINSKLQTLLNRADTIIENQERQITVLKRVQTWLEKIWNSIQEFFNPTDEDKAETDEFSSDSSEQSDKINDLNEQNETEKPDVDSTSSAVDENIDYDAMTEFGGVLGVITNNEYILQMILVAVSVLIISYILFGKR